MSKRPYITFSFKQLEAEYARGRKVQDRVVLEGLVAELAHRNHKDKPALKTKCTRAIKAVPQNQPDLDLTPGPPRRPHTPRTSGTRKPGGLKPTVEQQDAVDAFLAGKSLKINAYAGTGKTSTLQLLAGATSSRGQYIAFNRDIVTDAKEKFPSTVNCSTTHGLAVRAVSSAYRGTPNKLFGQFNAHQLVELLGIQRRVYGEKTPLAATQQSHLVLSTIKRFAQSGDAALAAGHVPETGVMLAVPETTVDEIKSEALRRASDLWARMIDPRDPVPLGHDGYLKLWALSEPQLEADFILLDEAQDTNPVVLELLKKQRAQMVYVGDRYQQIYEWRGAVNAMELIDTDHTTYLTTSFRFGPAIAEYASKVLELMGEQRPIIGNQKITSSIGPCDPDAVLGRTNASTISAIIETLDAGRKPHLVGGPQAMKDLLKDVVALKDGQPGVSPELFGFAKWQEVVAFSKTEEGAGLLTFVNLVEKRGERQLLWALGRTVEAEKADLVVSTAHKSKGREWRTVRLMDDFASSRPRRPSDKTGPDFAELRLFYVAVTRAKERIEIPETLWAALTANQDKTTPRHSEQASGLPKALAPEPFRATRPQAPPSSATVQVRTKHPEAEREGSALAAPSQNPQKRRGLMKWLLG